MNFKFRGKKYRVRENSIAWFALWAFVGAVGLMYFITPAILLYIIQEV